MPPARDLTGFVVGRLTALEPVGRSKHGRVLWRVRCDCGREKVLESAALTSQGVQSCGCLRADARHDLTGQRFGNLTATRALTSRRFNQVEWECLCDCGKTAIVPSGSLVTGNTRSCGCLAAEIRQTQARAMALLPKPKFRENLTGQRFGRLLVTGFTGRRRGQHYLWVCRCDCGTTVELERQRLVSGNTSSCGCLRHELRTTHGMTKTPEYRAWSNMRNRCNNRRSPAYPTYGGRGIVVDTRWNESFDTFLADVGPRPGSGYSLDRIDPNRGYEPGNVRWAVREVQANNLRRTVRVTAFGRTQSISQWSRETGLKVGTILNRLRSGWSPVRALSEPVDVRRKPVAAPADAP